MHYNIPMAFFYKAEELRAAAEEAVALARKLSADAAEARASESAMKDVGVRRGRLESAENSRELGLTVAVYLGARTGSADVGELSRAGIALAAERAMAIARASAEDPCFGLADAELMARDFAELSLHHPWEVFDDGAFAIARRCEEAAWGAHEKISREKSEGATVSSREAQTVYANSHGFCQSRATTMHSLYCSALAEENGAMEQDSWGDCARDARDLPSPEIIGTIAGESAGMRLGGRKLKSAKVPVLFRAPVSHSLIYHLISAASGGALYRNLSWLSADKLEKEKVCAAHLDIEEDPFLPGGLRSCNYDGEGVAVRKRAVVSGGIWRGCFLGSYSARRLKMQTTGNSGGAHNLAVSGRTLPFGDLMKEAGRAFMVTDLMGSSINPVTGDYSRGAAGFWIEGGEIAYPVNEATIAGNVRDILNNIIALGDDDNRRRSSLRCGSVLVGEMTVGGER